MMSNADLRLRMIFEGVNKASAPMRAVAVGSKAMAVELKKSSDELNRLNQVQGRITGFRTLKGQLTETSRELVAAEKKVGALAKTIATAEAPTRKMTAEFNRAKREASALKDKHGDQQRALQQLRGELNGAGVSTNNLVSDQAKLRTEMARVSTQIDQQKAKLGGLQDQESRMAAGRSALDKGQARASNMAVGGAAAMGTGIAIAAPLVAASREAITFESRMIDIQKVMNDVTPVQLNRIEAGLLKMSSLGPIAAEGLGQIAAEGARAGIAAKDLLSFTEGAMKMAAAFDIAAGEAGAMQAKWQTGLGLTIPQIMTLGDKVNALTNTYGGNAAAVTDMITRVGPLGKIAGVASGEMAALAQLMNKVGVESEIGATGIKRMMLTLNVGAAATDTQTAAFSALGLEAVKMSKMMQTDARGAILSVLDALNKLPKEQRAGVLTQLFGSESVASIAPLLGSLDQLKTNFSLVGDEAKYAGSMNREFEVAMSKTENQVSSSSNSIGVLQTVVGKQLIPAIRVGAGWIKTIAIGVADWAGKHPALVRIIGVTVGIIASLLIVVGALGIAIAGVLGPFALLRYELLMAPGLLASAKTAFIAVRGAVMEMNLAFLANPVVLIVMAIAAAALLIYTYWDDIGPYFKRLWEGVKSVFSGVFTVFKAILFTFTPAGLIYKHWDTLSPYFGKLWGAVKSAFMSHLELVKGFILNFTPAGLIYKHWDTLSPYFTALWNGVSAVFSTVWSVIKSAAEGNFNPGNMIIDRWSRITAFFSGLWARVGGVFSSAWGNIRTMMGGWAASAMQVGSNIVSSIASGIRNAPGAVWAALKGVVFGGIDKIKSLLGFGGAPSPTVATVPKLAGARAAGGPVGAGKAYLVGENGPEIFQPRNHGDIIPNHRIRTLAKAAFVGGGAGLLSASPALAAPRAAPSQSGNSYTIKISVEGDAQGVDEQRIAAAVRREIEAIERERGARNRSAYRDDA